MSEKRHLPAGNDPASGEERGPGFDDLRPELRERLLRLVPKLLELGMGRAFSAEDPADGRSGSVVDCERRTPVCKAVCCSFRFALTEEEANGGTIRFDEAHPCFIAQGSDGYCTHHDRVKQRCTIWDHRPLRCRRYSCLVESAIWEDGDSLAILPGTFDHLPGRDHGSR